MKGRKRLPFRKYLRKRLLERHKEHIGIKTSYNLFLLHPYDRLLARGRFLSDTDSRFPGWVSSLKDRGYKRALILGNAPCLTELTQEAFELLNDETCLSIGLNRSIYHYATDVLLWTDLLTIDELLKRRAFKDRNCTVLHAQLDRDHRLLAAHDRHFRFLHQYWRANHNFKNWPKDKLYMFRNSLVPALHLCYRLELQEVLLVGFGFDNREYFYKNEWFDKDQQYEQVAADKLDVNCGGYSTHKIVAEVLEYLLEQEGWSISYNGKSEFLGSIEGLKNVEVDEYVQRLARARD